MLVMFQTINSGRIKITMYLINNQQWNKRVIHANTHKKCSLMNLEKNFQKKFKEKKPMMMRL